MNELQFIQQDAGPTQLAKGKRKKNWEGTTTPSKAGRYADMSSVSESNIPGMFLFPSLCISHCKHISSTIDQ